MPPDALHALCGRRICAQRRACGFTQVTLATAVGVSGRMVGHWEQGVHLPAAPLLVKLSQVLHVSIDYLLGLSAAPEPVGLLPELVTVAQQLSASNLGWLVGFVTTLVREQECMREKVTAWAKASGCVHPRPRKR